MRSIGNKSPTRRGEVVVIQKERAEKVRSYNCGELESWRCLLKGAAVTDGGERRVSYFAGQS